MASIPGTSPSRELRTKIRGRSVRSSASPGAALFVVSMARPLREIPSARYSLSLPFARPAWARPERLDIGSFWGGADDALARPEDGSGGRLADDVSIKSNRSRFVDLAIEALGLGLEAREHVGALLEHLEIFDHWLGPLGQPFARNDGRDARRIDDEQGGRDAALQRRERQVVNVVAHQMAGGLAR